MLTSGPKCTADAFSPACSGECVASWNSVIRDAGSLVGSSCPSLEILMNEAYPFTMSGGNPFRQVRAALVPFVNVWRK